MSLLLNGKTLEQWFFSNDDRRAFLTQWLTNIEYGLTEKQFCESLVLHGDDNIKLIGQAGLDGQGDGASLTQSLHGWFPGLILAGIDIAAKEGDTAKGLQAAINELKGGQQVVLMLAGLLALPFALCIGVSLLGLYVSGKILAASPNYSPNGQQVHDAFTTYGAPIASLACLCLLGLYFVLPRWIGQGRNKVNQWPLFALYKNAALGNLLSSLGNLLSCGMKLDDALSAIAPHSTPFMRAHIEIMREQRTGQDNLGKVLDTGLFIPLALSPLKILGSHVDYQRLLFQSASVHLSAAEKSMGRMQTILPKLGVVLAIACLSVLVGSSASDLINLT